MDLPEVFISMKKCLLCGALRPGDPLIKLPELRFVSSSSETSRSSGTIQTSQSSISSHPAFPDVSSNFVGRCGASLAIIVPCHLVCGMLESSFRLILHLGHLLGKVICSLYSRAPGRLQAHPWVLA